MDWGGIITYLVITAQQVRRVMPVEEDNEEVEECPGKTSLGKNNGHVEIGMKASGAPDVE